VVLAVSSAVAAEHADVAWMKDRMRIVHNPVVRTPRKPLTDVGPIFGFLGRLTKEKGVATLVDAFTNASLPSTARLVIGGDGPLRDAISAASLPGVELLGWLDDAEREKFYDRIHCLVVPSQWKDPAPLVVNEARARNIPVIGARIGGIPELVAPSSRPLLFRANDRGELVDRLVRFAGATDRYASDRNEDLMDWDGHLKLVLDAYDTALRRAQTGT
jgi:glycosyltransferase involved in cell wall biosynthesis